MDVSEIRRFYERLNYDFNTITYLIDYGRLRETLVIMERVLNGIDSFRHQAINFDSSLGDVFSEDFFDQNLRNGRTLKELRADIGKFSKNIREVTDEDLESLCYVDFVERIHGWALKNVSLLKNIVKSPLQRKLEKGLSCFLGIVTGAGILAMMIGIFLTKDWGLRGDFYKGENFESKISTAISKTIDFNDHLEFNNDVPSEHFSARWRGFLKVPQDGQYTFYTVIDDGVRLYIDRKPIIMEWSLHPMEEFKNTIFLNKGMHGICLEYYQAYAFCGLKLYWQPPGGRRAIIPTSNLRVRLR